MSDDLDDIERKIEKLRKEAKESGRTRGAEIHAEANRLEIAKQDAQARQFKKSLERRAKALAQKGGEK